MANLLTVDYSAGSIVGTTTGTVMTLNSIAALLPAALGAGGGLKIDGSGTALPVSAASLPLPTGAATLAKQPALGTAGAASADVITVQGVASMTALKVDGSAVTQPASIAGTVAVTESGTWTVQPGNTANTTPWLSKISDGTNSAAIKAASIAPLTTDAALVVSISPNSVNANGQAAMAASAPVVIASNQSAIPVTLTSTTLTGNSAVNIAQVNGATVPVGNGVQATAMRTTLATDSPGIVALGQTTKSASVPVAIASDQLGAATAANSLPITTGPALLGSYGMGANSGTMAAGLAANAPVFSFRYGAANLAIVRKIIIEADNITTAFVAGAAKFDLIMARSFSASDTGGTAGTLTTNNGKLRTSFATTGVSDLRISSTATLTAGTRTLDAQPIASVEFAVPTSIDADLLPTTNLFLAEFGQSPIVLAQNEGFVIQATVPGTGTWVFSARVIWDEVSAF